MRGAAGEEVHFDNAAVRLRTPNSAYHRTRAIPIDDEVVRVGRGTDGG